MKDNGITPSQTVGPFFKYGLTPNGDYAWNDAFTNSTLTPDVTGDRIRIEGRVFDGDGVAVPDCMLEIWQADAQGRFADPQDKRALPNASFRGFARCGTAPGLMVSKEKLPSLSVPQRAKPRKLAFGSARLSCGSAKRPCASACQISSMTSGTATPSPSNTRPSMRTRSPVTSGVRVEFVNASFHA